MPYKMRDRVKTVRSPLINYLLSIRVGIDFEGFFDKNLLNKKYYILKFWIKWMRVH